MMWKQKINVNKVKEIKCGTTLYLGVGAIEKIDAICTNLKKRDINKVMLVTSRSAYKVCGAWDVVEPALNKHQIEFKIYNQVTPNPTDIQVDEIVGIAKELGARAVIGIGGGSPIDAAKAAAILLAYPGKTCEQLFMQSFIPDKAVPVIAINTTHGTGTEVDRFAVISIPKSEFKPPIAYDCIYPLYAIDDPALTTKLPIDQTLYVSIDAINHVTEAATTVCSSPFSILLAKEAISTIAYYLPLAIKDRNDLTARYWLLYASAIAGMSFDNGMLHFTHALEHPLSAVKPELAHGLGLSMLLPAVLKKIYGAAPEVLAEIYAPIVPGLQGKPDEADRIAQAVESWLFDLGVQSKLKDEGFSEDDIDKLVTLVEKTPVLKSLVDLAPIDNPQSAIREIFMDSLQPMSQKAALN